MWQPIWHLLKLIAYVLPFLHEVTDEKSVKNEQDAAVVKHLKMWINSVLVRLLYFCAFIVMVFYFAIPLYTEKRVLEHDLEKRNEEILLLNRRVEKFSDLLTTAQRNTRNCEVKLMSKDEDIRRLTNTIAEYHRAEVYKSMSAVTPPPVQDQPVKPPVAHPPKRQPVVKPVKQKPVVSSEVEQRLKLIE